MMNDLPKRVFSRTLDKVDWNNARLAKGDASEEIAILKPRPGKGPRAVRQPISPRPS